MFQKEVYQQRRKGLQEKVRSGLDVHDMEGLGEDLVGYDETLQRSK